MEHRNNRNPLWVDHKKIGHSGYGSINEAPTSRKSHETTMRSSASVDEFGGIELTNEKTNANKIMRTGRQRKKIASRSKGGEFQQRRKKRRVYFCCVSNEIDIEHFHDNFDKHENQDWKSRMYEGVLHLYYSPLQLKPIPFGDSNIGNAQEVSPRDSEDYFQGSPDGYDAHLESYTAGGYSEFLQKNVQGLLPIITEDVEVYNEVNTNQFEFPKELISDPLSLTTRQLSEHHEHENENSKNSQTASMLVLSGGKEVFVFDFGAVVFWGFKNGEEIEILEQIRDHVVKDCLSKGEFEEGQDDMAFVTSSDINKITIANDVITLPDFASAKSRLSVSFAIAQSAVLAIFEARIERKTEDYRYIPETLAARGKVKLSAKQLGGMIGEVYVIRHDVNLHSEILDTPDFFWKEDASVEDEYKLTMRYLEMENRTEILNKRLDMLRELLGVLQQQHENAHAVTVEWIVIWLIIISVVLEVFSILTNVLSYK